MTCNKCRFYVPDSRDDYKDKHGTCVRYPPAVQVVLYKGHPDQEAIPDWYRERPNMNANEWCGEYKRKSMGEDLRDFRGTPT